MKQPGELALLRAFKADVASRVGLPHDASPLAILNQFDEANEPKIATSTPVKLVQAEDRIVNGRRFHTFNVIPDDAVQPPPTAAAPVGLAPVGIVHSLARIVHPLVHLNGTSRQRLLEQARDTVRALDAAMDAMCEACPNARDYYPLGDDAFNAARRQFDARVAVVRAVREEYWAIKTKLEDDE